MPVGFAGTMRWLGTAFDHHDRAAHYAAPDVVWGPADIIEPWQ